MGKVRKFSHHKYWREDEVEMLVSMYAEKRYSREDLSKAFPGRAIRTVESKASSMGLIKDKVKKRSYEETLAAKREYQARKRASDPDGCREYANRIYASNREARKASMRRYTKNRFFWSKAHKLNPPLPAKSLAALWRSQRGLCALTGVRLGRTANLDHIIPKARGGSDHIGNLRWVSFSANMLKRDLLDEELFEIAVQVVSVLSSRLDQHMKAPQ